ncbi:MAG: type IV toxin-antitoxin system AbiEi family antitoxin domain-containing protein [Firmicutes bacterium]|nr:type IV toxin-antitoxin system AbiEi family antitoxin domain-containing protein [Bacillota bacterium]
MKDYSRLLALAKNGVIRTKDLGAAGIGRDYLRYAINDEVIEKAAYGIYILSNEIADKLYIFQLKNSRLIFSANTSAFLLGLTTRDSDVFFLSAPLSYNNPKLSQFHNIVRERAGIYGLGLIEAETTFGNTVKLHDAERTICDLFSPKYTGDKFVQVEALKNYLQPPFKNLVKLFEYAKVLGVYDELKKRIEVLL